MLQNNNTSSVDKLSKKILKANRLRNIFAVLAIALTTLLITTTLTAGITVYKTSKLYMSVSTYGIDADGYLFVNEKNTEKLKNIKNIKDVGITKQASFQGVKNKKLLNERVNLEYADKTAFEMMFIVPIEGTYPKNENDILAPTWVLEMLGADKKINTRINLDIEIDGKTQSKEFNLCGYYESLASRGSGRSSVFVSEDFIIKNNKEILKEEGSQTAFLNLKNLNDKSTKKEAKNEFKNIATEIGVSKYKEHPKFEDPNIVITNNNMNQMIAVTLGMIIVIFTGYLIIYNIFYISVNKDIRFYGLLKTIGTTSKQLKKIILKQALILSIIGIPVGLVLGYIVAKLLVPMAMIGTIFENVTIVSNNIYIFILAIVFSLITVYISCKKPGKVAGKVSPIEAIRFTTSDANTSKKKSKKGIGGAKVYKMAWSNIVKDKKKVCLSILSISLSALTIIFTINATLGLDPVKHADNQVLSDISISQEHGFFYAEGYKPITEELLKKVKSLENVKSAIPHYSVIGPEADGKIYNFGAKIRLSGKFKEEVESFKTNDTGYNGFTYAGEDGLIAATVNSLSSEQLEKEIDRVKIIDGKINKEEFKKGNQIIYYASTGKANLLKSGDTIELIFVKYGDNREIVEEIKKEFKIMAIVTNNEDGWSANNLGFINIEEEAFKNTFKDYKNYMSSIDIELKDNVNLDESDKEVQKVLLESDNPSIEMLSKNYYIEGIREMKNTYMTIGIVVAGILGFIGAINVLNTIFSGIFARKIEFAMLESIGMTKKQLKKMIFFEGIYYIILNAILITPLGALVSSIAPRILPIYGGVNLGIYALSVSICLLVISILILLVQYVGYKIVSKESIVERIRS